MTKPYMTTADRLALLEEVRAYCARTGAAEANLCRVAVGDQNYPSRLRTKRRSMGWASARKLRAFIAANPAGLPDVRVPTHHERLMTEVAGRRAELDRRNEERAQRAALIDRVERAGQGADAPVAAALLETPSDLMRMIQRRAPDLMRQVIETAREAGEMPGDLILSMIEQGLAERCAA